MGYICKGMLLIMLLTFFITACGKSPEKARKELGQMGIEYSEQSFIKTVLNGDKLAVELFLAAGMNANTRDSDGRTALNSAISEGHEDIADILLQKGADVNAFGYGGLTALMSAAGKDYPTIAKKLIKKGADINAKSDIGFTALLFAAHQSSIETIKVLINEGANVNEEVTSDYDSGGMTPLMIAARKGHKATAQLLLEKGANVNAKINKGLRKGYTALSFAIGGKHIEVAKILLDKGGVFVEGTIPDDTIILRDEKGLIVDFIWKQ